MKTFLFILIILAAIGAVVSIVRGVIIMLKTSREDLEGPGLSRSVSPGPAEAGTPTPTGIPRGETL